MPKVNTSIGSIFKLAIPIYIGMLSNTLVGVVDTGFMGRVGVLPQSAVGYGSLFYMVYYLMGFGFVLGAQIIIARRMGEGKLRRVGPIFINTAFVMLIYAALIILLVLLGIQTFFSLILNSEIIANQTATYLHIRTAGMPFSALNLCFMAFFVGTAGSRPIGISSIVSAMVNVVLDYMLIYGWGSIKPMGLEGAAWASAISDLSGTLVFIGYAILNQSFSSFHLKDGFYIRIQIIRQLFSVSTPLILQNFFSIFSWFLFFTFIEKTGERNFGISVILRSIYSMFMISAFALGSATNSMVSNLIGQGRQYEIGALVKRIIRISFFFIATISLPIWFFPETLFSIFTSDPSMAHEAVHALYVIGVAMLILSISNIYFQAVSGTGNTMVNLKIEAFCIGLYLLYTAATTQFLNVSLAVIWVAEAIYMISFGFLARRYMLSKRWMSKHLE